LDGEGRARMGERARLRWGREGMDGGGSARMKEGRLGWGRHGLFGEV
jgi:hypothetical protein